MLYYLRQGGYVFVAVCVPVCLSVSLSASKSYERISMKFSAVMGRGLETSQSIRFWWRSRITIRTHGSWIGITMRIQKL